MTNSRYHGHKRGVSSPHDKKEKKIDDHTHRAFYQKFFQRHAKPKKKKKTGKKKKEIKTKKLSPTHRETGKIETHNLIFFSSKIVSHHTLELFPPQTKRHSYTKTTFWLKSHPIDIHSPRRWPSKEHDIFSQEEVGRENLFFLIYPFCSGI